MGFLEGFFGDLFNDSYERTISTKYSNEKIIYKKGVPHVGGSSKTSDSVDYYRKTMNGGWTTVGWIIDGQKYKKPNGKYDFINLSRMSDSDIINSLRNKYREKIYNGDIDYAPLYPGEFDNTTSSNHNNNNLKQLNNSEKKYLSP